MDTENYREWNPVFVAVDRPYIARERVTNSVRFPDSSITEMKATIKTLAAGQELRQFVGTPGLITADHQRQLEPVEGGTRVIQHEVDRGIVLWFINLEWVEPAYQSVLEALRQRIEEEKPDAVSD